MTSLSVLLFGLGLGIRHAMDTDHIVVVSTLVQRERGLWRAARVAAIWGLGHTLAFLGVGLLVVLLELRVPAVFELATELLVAAMLIVVGSWHAAQSFRSQAPSHLASTVFVARPLGIGLVHGLAGSAGAAILAVTAVDSRALAAAYLCVVAFGTVLGMVALTVVLSRPIAWTMEREGWLKKAVTIFAGALGIGLGIWMLSHALLLDPAA